MGDIAIDLTNQTFGNLTVIAREGRIRTSAAWRCKCTCGEEVLAVGVKLRAGQHKSCAKNGHRWMPWAGTGYPERYPREYQSWKSMRARCLQSTNKKFPQYGGAGITVCARWDSFANFFADMGEKPTPKHTIDRYPNNRGNYEPDNCRWATDEQQRRNMKNNVYVEYEGGRILLMDLAKIFKKPLGVVYARLKTMGWSLEKALATPVRPKAAFYVTHEGQQVLLVDLVKRRGLKYSVVHGRLVNGWSLEEAIGTRVRRKRKKRA